MSKGVSSFRMYLGSLVIVFLLLTVAGCSKKVSPVVGSEGLASDSSAGTDSASQETSAQGGLAKSDSGQGTVSDGRSEDMAASGGVGSNKDVPQQRTPPEDSSKPMMAMPDPGLGFKEDVYFDFDKWIIRGDAKDVLTGNARWLVENSNVLIQIEGHGDERGTNEYNLALGERRARSTERYLINLGVSPSRISFISYGEEKNICGENHEDCFQRNRRAHFIVKKQGE